MEQAALLSNWVEASKCFMNLGNDAQRLDVVLPVEMMNRKIYAGFVCAQTDTQGIDYELTVRFFLKGRETFRRDFDVDWLSGPNLVRPWRVLATNKQDSIIVGGYDPTTLAAFKATISPFDAKIMADKAVLEFRAMNNGFEGQAQALYLGIYSELP